MHSLLRATLLSQANDTAIGGESGVTRPGIIPDGVPIWVLEVGYTVVVLMLASLVARLLVHLFSRRIAQHFERPSLTRVSLAAIRVGVYIFALLTILRIFGLDLGNIALSVTVFSAVLGVVLAPIVGSIISGVFLLADQPYEIGDMVELTDQGTRGYIEDITLRYTKIFTLDNTFLVVPNGEMRSRDVVNYSAEDTRVRLTLDVLLTYESELATAREKIQQSARAVDGVLSGGPGIRIGSARYPASPQCLIADFADDGILLRLRYWVQEPYRIPAIRSEVSANIWDAFEGEAVEIAYPHSHLVFDETSGELQLSTENTTASEESPDVSSRYDTGETPPAEETGPTDEHAGAE
ncbi:mechanosensitive ion channel family protein [Halovenus salina]|uniref:Mechanosensitive ion channel family protein n=1 Tax=Halovenus salina TaxID=1510225 RepID=A0ABD5W799_9EURY|nr:mechanosensitive ion channel family protein [Halovenus salina]